MNTRAALQLAPKSVLTRYCQVDLSTRVNSTSRLPLRSTWAYVMLPEKVSRHSGPTARVVRFTVRYRSTLS